MQNARGQMDAPGPSQGYHPLLGKFDSDPGRWRPLHYGVDVSVPVTAGGIGQASLALNNQPYVLTSLSAKIMGPTADPSTSGLYQDGQYDVEWRDEQTNYTNGFICPDLMWGSFQYGTMKYLPIPIAFSGNRTLTFRVRNRVLRALASQDDFFIVQICVDGMGDWGTEKP